MADDGGSGSPGTLTFGYYPKDEALRLVRILEKAGVAGRLGFDRDFSRQHARATRINPALSRRSSFRDVKSGYFVEISEARSETALAAIAKTSFRASFVGNSPLAGPVRCAACDRPLPPEAEVCPDCDRVRRRGEVPAEPPRRSSRALRRGLVLTAILALLAILISRLVG